MSKLEDMTSTQLIIAEGKASSQTEKDIIRLRKIEISIVPGSCWYRWGYLGSLRRARKLMQKKLMEEQK